MSDRYINQPEKGPNFHTNEFMRGYNDGYDACSNTSNPRPSNQGNGNGLRIIVDFRFDAGKLCLYEFEDSIGNSIDCSEPDGPGEITFETNQIADGERFKVCEESEYPRFIHCETGENGSENEPEYLCFN